MDDVRIIWTGALDGVQRDRFRQTITSALDRARPARLPVVVDLAQLGAIDQYGVASLIALGHTARSLQLPVTLAHAPWHLRVDMEAANAYTLFRWWPHHDDE